MSEPFDPHAGEHSDDAHDDVLDALLRHTGDGLSPPTGSWEHVSRRARRRKWGKAALSAAAVAVVLAGAVPSILAVRHSSNDQSLELTDSPTPSHTAGSNRPAPSAPTTTPTPSGSLAGFAPTSLSFVTPTEGYLLGSTDAATGVLARTQDGGKTWTKINTPEANARVDGVRFATSDDGVIFGKTYEVTHDGGTTWTATKSPGYISDLETARGGIWALVSKCADCESEKLYSATVADPTLTPVTSVPAFRFASISAYGGGGVYVAGDSNRYPLSLWALQSGSWHQVSDPCSSSHRYESQSVAAWSPSGLVLVCSGQASVGRTFGRGEFRSFNGGSAWKAVHGNLGQSGNPGPITAGTANNIMIVLGDTRPIVTDDGGQHWKPSPIPISWGGLSFAGFISATHVVAIPANLEHAFLSSSDAGKTWHVTRFP